MGRCITYTGIRLLLFIQPFFSFFFLSNFQRLKIFVTLFSGSVRPRRLKLVHTWTVGRCIMYTEIRLLLLIYFFISSFFFLSNFQTLKSFVTLFSGTVRPRRLKLGTHMILGSCIVLPESGCLFITFLSFFFLSNVQRLNIFVTLFSGTVRSRRLKIGTHVDRGQMCRVYWNQAAAAYSSLYFFIFLSFQFSNIKIFLHTFLRNCETW